MQTDRRGGLKFSSCQVWVVACVLDEDDVEQSWGYKNIGHDKTARNEVCRCSNCRWESNLLDQVVEHDWEK